ncbi:MAG TPA: OpgC domain-containing protein [Tepidisphaeraceae bacterium]|nr:OpgC domain-containing protein [Tepidisphaeraceae bacterium]
MSATTVAEPLPLTGRRPRDERLDFWRGLCLMDMLLVHLIYGELPVSPLVGAWLGDYTRFAAGGFVAMAGLAVGVVYLPRAREPARRRAAYGALWRRAGWLLVVHCLLELAFLVLAPLEGRPVEDLPLAVADVLMLRAGQDLLPFYVMMLLAAPALLEVLRRRAGWALLLGGSVALHLWAGREGGTHVWAWPLPHQSAFFPGLWQLMFVAGLLAGAGLPRYDTLSARAKLWVAAGSVAAALATSLWAYSHDLGIDLRVEWLPFAKVPLTPMEAVRYLAVTAAIMTVSDLAWRRWLASSSACGEVCRMGRQSLALYVAQAWIVLVCVKLAYRTGATDGAALLIGGAGVVALWGVAVAMEWWRPRRAGRRVTVVPRDVPASPLGWPAVRATVGVGCAVALALGLAHGPPLQGTVSPPPDVVASSSATTPGEAAHDDNAASDDAGFTDESLRHDPPAADEAPDASPDADAFDFAGQPA